MLSPLSDPPPEQLHIERGSMKNHIAFAAGLNACLGRILARLEANIVLRLFFRRFPRARLLPDRLVRDDAISLSTHRLIPVQLY